MMQETQRKSHKSLAENIPEPHHSGVHSQVFLSKAAQRNGDMKELASKEEGKPVEQKEEVEDREEKENKEKREQNEKEGVIGKKEMQRGKPQEAKGKTLEEQGLNIHIEQELYMDIQAWIKGEVWNIRVEERRRKENSRNIKKENSQPGQKDPDIRGWLNRQSTLKEVKSNTSGGINRKDETAQEIKRCISREDTRTVVKAEERKDGEKRRVIARQKFIDK